MERSLSPSIANRVKRWEFLELDNAARALEDLERHPGWSVLQDILAAEIRDLDAQLDGGDRPLEQATYALLHGKRSGLKSSKDAVATVIAKHRDLKAQHEAEPVAPGGR